MAQPVATRLAPVARLTTGYATVSRRTGLRTHSVSPRSVRRAAPATRAILQEPGVATVTPAFASDVPPPGKRIHDKGPFWRIATTDIVASASSRQNYWLGREWTPKDKAVAAYLAAMHLGACLAPLTFTPAALGVALGLYFVTGCLGITLSYHRQLSHKAFVTPKWLEYALAYCGAAAVQGDPIDWVSTHRAHHQFTDTKQDPHTPYEGAWWSHAGWVLDHAETDRRVDRDNAADLASQPFYTHLREHYVAHMCAQAAALFAAGQFLAGGQGLPFLVWGWALRCVWVYHVTWFVNSATHLWGYQSYNTGDLSKVTRYLYIDNNWWVGLLAFGEGWHNNHHAFEYSARHGLDWWQLDLTYYCIWALEKVGLASKVKLPTEAAKAKLAFK